jgi:transposase-like protein
MDPVPSTCSKLTITDFAVDSARRHLSFIGVDEHRYKSILAIKTSSKDGVNYWKAVLSSLKSRVLDGQTVRLGIMDGLPCLEKKFAASFPNALMQRCREHPLGKALAKPPTRLRKAF